jgi:hypothetical protein
MNKIIIVSVVVLSAMSGCFGVETKKPSVEIVSHGDLSIEGEEFSYNATIETSTARTSENFTFEKVNLSLYNGNEKQIKSARVGSVSSLNNGSTNVKIESETIPKYIIVESPEFWTLSDVEVKVVGLKWVDSDDRYREYFVTSESGKFDS